MSNINGTSGSDGLTGSTASDQILGFQGDDTIAGGGGNDTIYGGQGKDGITFGIGNGTSFDQPGANGSSLVVGGEGADTIRSLGGLGNNTVLGGTGDPAIDARLDKGDTIDLTADRGRDVVAGNYGDDTISLGVGGATAFGGMGNDVIDDNGSTLFGNGGRNGGVEAAIAQSNAFGSANDIIFGGEGEDTIDVSAFGNSTIVGGTGNRSIDVSADGADLIFFDQSATVLGQNGPTPLVGNDLVLGNFGDDTIDALGVYGQGQAPGGSDTLVGGMDNDLILAGQQANDILLGNQGNDLIFDVAAQNGTDTIYGGQGDDTIVAGNIFTGQTPNELVYGGEGNDGILTLGTGNDTLFGGIDSTGGSADGSNAFDIELQAGGNDLIFGGPNADYVLVGTTDAAATVTGGTGADTVSFVDELSGVPADGGSAFNGLGKDTVTDFISGTDKFDVPAPVTYTDVEGVISGKGSLAAKAGTALADAASNRSMDNGTVGVNAVVFQTQAGGDHYLAIDNDSSGDYTTGTDLLIDIKGTSTVNLNDFLNSANNVVFSTGGF